MRSGMTPTAMATSARCSMKYRSLLVALKQRGVLNAAQCKRALRCYTIRGAAAGSPPVARIGGIVVKLVGVLLDCRLGQAGAQAVTVEFLWSKDNAPKRRASSGSQEPRNTNLRPERPRNHASRRQDRIAQLGAQVSCQNGRRNCQLSVRSLWQLGTSEGVERPPSRASGPRLPSVY